MTFMPYLLATALAVAAFDASAAAPAPAPDAGLYTTYALSSDATSVSASVCGAVGGTSGCYGGGTLVGFRRACAVIEGAPAYKGATVTRMVYVLDGQVSDTATAHVWIYRKTDAIATGFDTVTFKLHKKLDTMLPAGKKAGCYLAADDGYVFAGTSAATSAIRLSKATDEITIVGGFSPPSNLVGITADDRGWISVDFAAAFLLFDPSGNTAATGGGAAWVASARNGLTFGH